MRRFRHSIGSSSSRSPLWAVGLIVILLAGLMAFSLWRTTKEANQVDVERTAQAIQAVMQKQVDGVGTMAIDNSHWDDAAIELNRPVLNLAHHKATWGTMAPDGPYDTSFAITESGRFLFGYKDQKPLSLGAQSEYRPALLALAKRISLKEPLASGIIATQSGPRIVAIGLVFPLSEGLTEKLKGKPPIYLGFSKPVDAKMLAESGKMLNTHALRIARESDMITVPINGLDSKQVLVLSWNPSQPGYQAVIRSLPVMAAGLLLCVMIITFLVRTAYRATNDLNEMALIDSLSQLPNRRALQQQLRLALKRKEPVALAFIDLDGFKAINDNYGHAVGDQLILQCAAAIMERAADCQTVSRLGGDEFAILAIGPGCERRLERAAKSVISRLASPFRLDERSIMIGASFGLASTCAIVTTASELMRRADIAMYASKNMGKMRLTWFDEAFDHRQAKSHEIEIRLRDAIDNERFAIHYQPLVDVNSREIVSVEALVRWDLLDPDILHPNEFIPVAEATGLINRLGLLVLRRACTDALSFGEISLSVNVSVAQLRDPDFAAHLRAILTETRFPPQRLEIEITESYIMLDPDMARLILDEIQSMGVKVSLDDFGSGYASIGFLRQFQFDRLKIDRSLVSDAVSDKGALAMLHSSVAVARAMGMSIVAEGVENEGQADLMKVAGCDQLQGWLFSKALDADGIRSILEAGGRTSSQLSVGGLELGCQFTKYT
jgi:diguanylate cyclase (GGDEF)-like protein